MWLSFLMMDSKALWLTQSIFINLDNKVTIVPVRTYFSFQDFVLSWKLCFCAQWKPFRNAPLVNVLAFVPVDSWITLQILDTALYLKTIEPLVSWICNSGNQLCSHRRKNGYTVIEFFLLKEYIYAAGKGVVNEEQINRLGWVAAEVLLKMQLLAIPFLMGKEHYGISIFWIL